MTEHEFHSLLDSLFTAVIAETLSKSDACEKILQLVKGMVNNKKHLELFIARVSEMRKWQAKFFKEKTSKALGESKQHEARVDQAIIKLCTDLGYDLPSLEEKAKQTTLF